MCTLTVSYDSENVLAIKMIELMRASGVFSFPTDRKEELSAREEKEAFLYTSRINAAKNFSKYL